MASLRGRIDAVVAWIILLGYGSTLVGTDKDPDLWGRMSYARDAWKAGRAFLPVDPYSYTAPGAPWVDHEWAFNWVSWSAWLLGGWIALRLLRLALFLGTTWLLSQGRTAPLARPLFSFLAGGATVLSFAGPRAQAFSFLFFAWSVLCLDRSWTRGPRWIVFATAPFPLWVNLHGGFLAGLALLGAWGGCRLLFALRERDRKTIGALGASGAIALGSTLLTPWGPGYLIRIARDAGMPRPFIGEWGPLEWNSWQALMFVALVALAIPGLLQLQPLPRRLSAALVVAGLAAASLLHYRHVPFLGIAVLGLTGEGLCDWLRTRAAGKERPPESERELRFLRWFRATLLLPLAMVALILIARMAAPSRESSEFPKESADWLESHTPPGSGVLADFNWAEYLIWRAEGRYRVAFDGRYEEVYPPAVQQRFFDWLEGFSGWQSLADDPATAFAFVRVGSSRSQRLGRLPGWERVHQDDQAEIWRKQTPSPSPGSPTAADPLQ